MRCCGLLPCLANSTGQPAARLSTPCLWLCTARGCAQAEARRVLQPLRGGSSGDPEEQRCVLIFLANAVCSSKLRAALIKEVGGVPGAVAACLLCCTALQCTAAGWSVGLDRPGAARGGVGCPPGSLAPCLSIASAGPWHVPPPDAGPAGCHGWGADACGRAAAACRVARPNLHSPHEPHPQRGCRPAGQAGAALRVGAAGALRAASEQPAARRRRQLRPQCGVKSHLRRAAHRLDGQRE